MLPLLACLALNQAINVHITVDPGRTIKTFTPQLAFGAGVDGHEHGDTARIFTQPNLKAMRSMGLQSLSYRLRTELGIEAWHWNPQGAWSDPARRQGYWMSDAKPGAPIRTSFGYSLPRRGDTVDQANNRGYSRLDDGDPTTFWKSNPYLDHRYTGDPNAKHPQWVLVDFADKVTVDTIKILWSDPYATRFRVEYWNGPPRVDEVDPKTGSWTTFPRGVCDQRHGGEQTVRLGSKPVSAQYVRIWLLQGSGTARPGCTDIRDRLGYSIRELSIGSTDSGGKFHDAIVHRKNSRQSEIIVSSTDPWHRASDRDRDVEQPGFDAVESWGLTNGLPMMAPVPVLYGVPEDAANELRWFKARGYPIGNVEMGEEPDGQMVSPHDYAALYLEVADRLKAVDPRVKLGGPCFQTTQHEFRDWPEPKGTPWLKAFLAYLDQRNRRKDLSFFSFEWYPFDDVTAKPEAQLLEHEAMFDGTLKRLQGLGLTHDIPWMITEYGYSAFAGPAEVELPGAILNTDIIGEFLTRLGDTAYLYGYEPGEVIREKGNVWGNLMALMTDPDSGDLTKLPTYYSAWLLTHAWCGDLAKAHRLVASKLSPASRSVGCYSLLRPDGRLAMLLVNRSDHQSAYVHFDLPAAWRHGSAVLYRYGQAQYAWKPAGENGRPLRSLPPEREFMKDVSNLTLSPYSVSVAVFNL